MSEIVNTSGEFAKLLSETTGTKLGSVNAIGQQLRNAGLLSIGGRGRSASNLSEVDIANWSIAVAASNNVGSSVKDTTNFLEMPKISSMETIQHPDIKNTMKWFDKESFGEAFLELLYDIKNIFFDNPNFLFNHDGELMKFKGATVSLERDFGRCEVQIMYQSVSSREVYSTFSVFDRRPDDMEFSSRKFTITGKYRSLGLQEIAERLPART